MQIDVNNGAFQVVMESVDLNVVVGDSAKIDVGQAINYIKSGQAEIEQAVDAGIAEFDANATAKTNAFNQNAGNKTTDFNNNASAKTQDYNDNATAKLNAYNQNATDKTNAFNSNATNKTTAFNNNAIAKTGDFDTNATNKTNTFNQNATDKTTAFNNNATSKTNDFNDNYTAKKALIDAQVGVATGAATTATNQAGLAKQWAIGDPSEPTGNSAKYWAEQAGISATNASTSETNAGNSATTATTKAGEASASATIATNQAGIATTKANDASNSATTATTQAGIATSKAGAAATSATNAGISETNAGNSATSASNSANSASASASLAQNWANKLGGTVDGVEYSAKYYAEQAHAELVNKQDKLTAGDFINIDANNNITTTYTAGTGIAISSSGVISNTQTSAEWGNITGTLSNQTDLQNALNAKYDASNPNGYTSNVGTVTSVNNTSPDGNGNVTLSIPAAQVNSDWNANSGVAQILNKPTLGTMAAESASDYTKTSGLATVATTGSYNDLLNKPTIPAAQIQSDWTQADNTKLDYIKNKPSLATVATTGAYGDLSGTPTIPVVDQTYSASSANAQSGVAVASAISGKANTDLSNINPTATAKSNIVGWGAFDFSAAWQPVVNTDYTLTKTSAIVVAAESGVFAKLSINGTIYPFFNFGSYASDVVFKTAIVEKGSVIRYIAGSDCTIIPLIGG